MVEFIIAFHRVNDWRLLVGGNDVNKLDYFMNSFYVLFFLN